MPVMEQSIYKQIAEQIERLMDLKGLKQTDLAAKMKVSNSFLTKFFKYGNKITIERLIEILDILGYNLDFSEKKTSLMSG